MSDLISREEAINAFQNELCKTDEHDMVYAIGFGGIERIINKLPSIDAVPVIRCKDCKHRPSGTGANHDLEFPDDVCSCQCADDYWYSWMPKDDWFCADGERKEE